MELYASTKFGEAGMIEKENDTRKDLRKNEMSKDLILVEKKTKYKWYANSQIHLNLKKITLLFAFQQVWESLKMVYVCMVEFIKQRLNEKITVFHVPIRRTKWNHLQCLRRMKQSQRSLTEKYR